MSRNYSNSSHLHEEIQSGRTKSFSVHVRWCKLESSNAVAAIHFGVEDATIKRHPRSKVLDFRLFLKLHYDSVFYGAK